MRRKLSCTARISDSRIKWTATGGLLNFELDVNATWVKSLPISLRAELVLGLTEIEMINVKTTLRYRLYEMLKGNNNRFRYQQASERRTQRNAQRTADQDHREQMKWKNWRKPQGDFMQMAMAKWQILHNNATPY